MYTEHTLTGIKAQKTFRVLYFRIIRAFEVVYHDTQLFIKLNDEMKLKETGN